MGYSSTVVVELCVTNKHLFHSFFFSSSSYPPNAAYFAVESTAMQLTAFLKWTLKFCVMVEGLEVEPNETRSVYEEEGVD
jgi:hypothetical protein